MPLISVITPVYNNKKYITTCARSILDQSFRDIEYILVDDGSTDGTGELLDELAETDARIKVIHQENQWIYASFNNGIRAACGEYIYIVNSDDKLRDGILEKLAEKVLEYRNPDVIWTKVLAHKCDADQNILHYNYLNMDEKVSEEFFCADDEAVHANWFFFYRSTLAVNQANLYKREIALRHPFRNDVYGADTLFNISIAPEVHSALVLREPAYDHFLYDIPGMNASTGKFYGYEHRMFNDFYTGYRDLLRSWDVYTDEVREYFCRWRMRRITWELREFRSWNCNFTMAEKVHRVFAEYVDDVLYECAGSLDAVEEMESRILSGLREMFLLEEIPEEDEMYFAYELLESLLRYEKTDEDFRRIERAIEHPMNPYHIGQAFYGKLKEG